MNDTIFSTITIITGFLVLIFQKNIIDQNIRAFSKKSLDKDKDRKIYQIRVIIISMILIIYGILSLISK
ncbi:hypothetical protein ACX8XP_11905 [Calditrichota bacterium LG25]